VATLGTATTPNHVQKLLRTSDKIVFSFDGDKAGRRAAWRALQTCLPLLRDDASIRFLFLPAEHDPDSYVREYGAEAFRAALAEAVPLSRFMLEELASRHPMDEAEGRSACVHEAKPLLALIPESALRIQIEREFARLVQLTPDELAQMLAAMPAPAPARGSGAAEPAGARQGGSEAPGFAPAAEYHEPPGFMDDDAAGFEPDFSGAYPVAPARSSAPRRGEAGTRQSRAVTPMAKRLLRLLLAHPDLVSGMGDQQLEILEQSPHLALVRDLIALASTSGARHVGALLQAAEPESELALLLGSMSSEILAQEDLPDPLAEWNDALHRIELEAIKAEQSALIQSGLADEASRQRYQKLTRRLALLNSAS